MDAEVQKRLAALESYLESLAPTNLSWNQHVVTHDPQEKPKHAGTFTGRLHQEYSPTKRAEVLRSDEVDESSFPRAPTGAASGAPVRIMWSLEYGRYLVASRSITAGEVVFRETPLVVAPKPDAGPTCLVCLRALQGAWVECEGCGAPLCSSCADDCGHGGEECELLVGLGLKQDPRNIKLIRKLNALLTPLRTMMLMQDSPDVRSVVAALQSNVEKRRRLPIGRYVEEHVVESLQRRLGLGVSSVVVHHLCGVFDTNAFVVSLGKDRMGRALFPLGAIMNHSCVPNTQHWYKEGVLTVRAVTDIPEGAPITNTYTPTLWGTHARAAHLAASKLFTCRCERCLDPIELGSHISSVSCRSCQDGLLVPPSDPRRGWECHACGASASGDSVEAMVRAAGAAVSRISPQDAAAISSTLGHFSRVLGRTHYITVELKYALIHALMTPSLKGVSDADLCRVVDLSKELLRLAAIIDPGLSRFRGVVLLELGRASAESLERRTPQSSPTADPDGVSTAPAADTVPGNNGVPGSEAVVVDDDDDDKGRNTSLHHSTTPTPFIEAQDLLSLVQECENILQYDRRLPDVLALKQQLQTLL
ncbi:uncharacterized protein [Panulirus ornatus]|uniref:uncharacterized protein n=1 Tax=Panulirus ornatus TaxID=150431 RepID=UPI003A86D82B